MLGIPHVCFPGSTFTAGWAFPPPAHAASVRPPAMGKSLWEMHRWDRKCSENGAFESVSKYIYIYTPVYIYIHTFISVQEPSYLSDLWDVGFTESKKMILAHLNHQPTLGFLKWGYPQTTHFPLGFSHVEPSIPRCPVHHVVPGGSTKDLAPAEDGECHLRKHQIA